MLKQDVFVHDALVKLRCSDPWRMIKRAILDDVEVVLGWVVVVCLRIIESVWPLCFVCLFLCLFGCLFVLFFSCVLWSFFFPMIPILKVQIFCLASLGTWWWGSTVMSQCFRWG